MASHVVPDRNILSGLEFLDLTNVSDEDAHRIHEALIQNSDDLAVQFLQDDDPSLYQLLKEKPGLDFGVESSGGKDSGDEDLPSLHDVIEEEPVTQQFDPKIVEHQPPKVSVDDRPKSFPENSGLPPNVHPLAYSVPASMITQGYYAPVQSIYVNTVTANVSVHGGGMPYGMPHLRAYEEATKAEAEQNIPGFAHGPPPFMGPAFMPAPIFHHPHHPTLQSVTGAPFVIQAPYYYPQYTPVIPTVAPAKHPHTSVAVSPKKPVAPVIPELVKLAPKEVEVVAPRTEAVKGDLQFGDVTDLEISELKETKVIAEEEVQVKEQPHLAPVASSESSEVTSPEPESYDEKSSLEPEPNKPPQEKFKDATVKETTKPAVPAAQPTVNVVAQSVAAASVQPAAAPSKSWASLFKSSSSPKPVAKVAPVAPQTAKEEIDPMAFGGDPDMHKLAVHLGSYALEHEATSLQPRGLLNKGNYCYINAVLQVLIGCPPFYKMIKAIEPIVKTRTSTTSSTPVIDSLVNYIGEFASIPPPATPNPKTKKAPAKQQITDVNQGQPFEPNTVYNMLQSLRGSAFKEMGRQEDAEELLTVLLNALNDEMIELSKLIAKPPVVNGTTKDKAQPTGAPEDTDEWQLIGPKNKGVITRSATFCRTPVSDLFLGQMRSALQTEKGQSTATLQPFFTLQLDIQNEDVNSVREALDAYVSKEPLLGYIDPKNKQEVEASRQTTLEALPPVLMLHLKCFLYDKSGGCQKLIKKIDVPLDLEIQKDVLSPSIKTKLSAKQRQYQLFAVVYHDGKEATKGHYIADVHHCGLGVWIRYDDSVVKVIDEKQLLRHSPPRVPYLLLYRRRES